VTIGHRRTTRAGRGRQGSIPCSGPYRARSRGVQLRSISTPSVVRRAGAAAVGIVVLASLLPATAQAAPARAGAGHGPQQRRADYDSRDSLGAAAGGLSAASARPTRSGPPPAAVRELRGRLGVQGIVDIDDATGTPRRVARLDGFLTTASRKKTRAGCSGYAVRRGRTARSADPNRCCGVHDDGHRSAKSHGGWPNAGEVPGSRAGAVVVALTATVVTLRRRRATVHQAAGDRHAAVNVHGRHRHQPAPVFAPRIPSILLGTR